MTYSYTIDPVLVAIMAFAVAGMIFLCWFAWARKGVVWKELERRKTWAAKRRQLRKSLLR